MTRASLLPFRVGVRCFPIHLRKHIRFTRNKANTVLYALPLGWPTEPVLIRALGKSAPTNPGKAQNVQLLGLDGKLPSQQTAEGLRLEPPAAYRPAVSFAAACKVNLR